MVHFPESSDSLLIHDVELIHLSSQLKAGKGLTVVGVVMDTPNLGIVKDSFPLLIVT